MSEQIRGHCLCGAVTVTSTMDKPALRACHCDMCRQQNSGAFMSISNDPQDVTVTGEIKVYRSSEWAERAFCPICGSTLWYSTVHDGARHLSAGLFENAGGAPLKLEFFADKCPEGYRFEGAHKRLSTDETIAMFGAQAGDDA
ncbi:GFA family protein [Marimonas sp. MJW-29]|uniref:GFA family protein n=1 Tax=Sulfitobacter sediminis TaxID=3234186 RepID=A0ABV3RPR2_9RHOB